jgi:hypothetical protein
MHWQYYPLVVSTPASTPAASPASAAFPIVQGEMRSMRIQIPAGHNGRTGIRVAYHGTVVMPWSLTGWLIGSGDTFTIPWNDEVNATGWNVQTYNTDRVSHSFYLYAEVLPVLGTAPGVIEGTRVVQEIPEKTRLAISRIARVKQAA